MKCIVCLGNPGKKYRYTRHNIGFLVAENILQHHPPAIERQNALMDLLSFSLQQEKVLLLIPLTYMNNSGTAVQMVKEDYSLSTNDMLVLYDDFQLPFGTLRIRPKGSDGGHNGIGSVIYSLETEAIPRLRVGVQTAEMPDAHTHETMASFVLSNFTESEMKLLPRIIQLAEEAVFSWLQDGIEKTMSVYNKNFFHDTNVS
ncbi:MAG: aminoacyl-tRNA hydrolase [Bacteroidetes bacterium]|nr:aminoacyl-tRNA hydrolase [Bacteroidota bacterium]